MSMTLTVSTIADNDIHDILKCPLLQEVLLTYGEDKDALFDELADYEDIDGETETAVRRWNPVTTERQAIHLVGVFQALHCLLTGQPDSAGTSFPLNFIQSPLHTGREKGWRPVSYFFAAEVRDISAALNAMTADILHACFDPEVYNSLKIYPGANWEAEDIAPLVEQFQETKAFIAKAAEAGKGIFLILM
ncbi:DUF1877 family protein [Chitinophaga varians]|uniref:DUF1877 family protein n=1 Tax=Chitinophaga varians TaxID=2202339 RepID=UPI00165F6FA5|nr:DUF1877 family protein [Chitinophaga varians]MBC9915156.1 DUF1877 family protein [Chitinophaga varians]